MDHLNKIYGEKKESVEGSKNVVNELNGNTKEVIETSDIKDKVQDKKEDKNDDVLISLHCATQINFIDSHKTPNKN